MIEAVSFFLGVGFSVFVYYRSIRPAPLTPAGKALSFVLSLIGISGMIFLFGVMASFVFGGKN